MIIIMLSLVAFAATGYFVRSGLIKQLLGIAIVVFMTATIWLTGKV